MRLLGDYNIWKGEGETARIAHSYVEVVVEAKAYNKIMNGSVCVDSPSHRHTCGQKEKHTPRTEPACSLENVKKDYG